MVYDKNAVESSEKLGAGLASCMLLRTARLSPRMTHSRAGWHSVSYQSYLFWAVLHPVVLSAKHLIYGQLFEGGRSRLSPNFASEKIEGFYGQSE